MHQEPESNSGTHNDKGSQRREVHAPSHAIKLGQKLTRCSIGKLIRPCRLDLGQLHVAQLRARWRRSTSGCRWCTKPSEILAIVEAAASCVEIRALWSESNPESFDAGREPQPR